MVKFKVPLKDILQNAYYQYKLSSSNYNPTINSTITITCTCKNVLGNPIANKTLTLMMNGVSQGTSTTNSLGVATWTVTCDEIGLQDFRVENQSIQVKVKGETIRLVDSSQYGIIWSVDTETGVSMITYNNTQTINANSYNTVKNPYTTGDTRIKYCPHTSIYAPTSIQNVYITVTYMGEMRLYNRSSTKQSSVSVQGGISFVGKEYRG